MHQFFIIFATKHSMSGDAMFILFVLIGGFVFIAHVYFSTLSQEKINLRAQELFDLKCKEIEETKNKLLAEKIEYTEELKRISEEFNVLKLDYKALQKENEDLRRNIQLYENKDPSYEKVAEYLKKNEGDNSVLFITGNAGSGKSYIIEHLSLRLKGCVLLAPTGVSASIIHGATIHSFFKLPPKLLDKADIKNSIEKAKDKINITKYLLIDEISMVSAYMMDCIDEILRKAKNSNKAFGGIKLVVAGDLYQLPPVITKEYGKILNLKGKKNEGEYDYFFKADVFRNMKIEMLFLEDQHRADKEFCSLLDNIRDRNNLTQTLKFFNDRVSAQAPKNALKLMHRNKDVDAVNQDALSNLKSKEYNFHAYRITSLNGKIKCQQGDPVFKDIPFSQCLTLKRDALVMFVINMSDGIYNGTMGIVRDIKENGDADCYVDVEKLSTKKTERVTPYKWDLYEYEVKKDEEGKNILKSKIKDTIYQIPLELAFATTVHKAQGKTIDKVYYDGANPFASGQTYVGLSRTKRLTDLTLKQAIKDMDIIFDESVKDFYMMTERIKL